MSTIPPYDEKQLLASIAEGDEKAFERLFTWYYPQVYALVHRFSLNDEDVREALQETFLIVWLKRDQLMEINDIRGWLLRIASRQCRQVLRKNILHKRVDPALPEMVTPAEDLQVVEVKHLIHEAILEMPDQRRRIYLLSREEGCKPSEIAERLGLSVSTVKNTLVTALKHIRDYLHRAGYVLPHILLVFFYFD